MGSGNHFVIDLSSDEEFDTRVDIDYFDWLSEIKEVVDEKSDSTDVVEVVSEVKSGGVNSQYRKPISSVVDDDDDCVILDGDPDKTAKTSALSDDDKSAKSDDDDVLVVGQKGEIACRDFPHPRHSCAKYAFNSTSHEKYCDMCHCYVCDIRAPCPYWCIGGLSSDHCHANDKEKIWTDQREFFRTGIMPTEPSSKPKTPLPASSTVPLQFSQSSTPSIIRLSQNPLPRNSYGMRPCSSSTNIANISNSRARYRQSFPHNHRLQNRPVQSLSSVRNNVIQKDRSSYIRPPQLASSGTRYGATNVNSIKMGLYTTNAPIHHSSSIPAPTINPGIYTQHQPNVTDYRLPVPRTQSNVHSIHPVQNKSGRANYQFQANANLLAVPETPQQAQTVQQQPGTNENVLQSKLLDVESWLMDSSNQTGPGSPLAEPVGQDSLLSFDFEDLLND